jgi:NitT/TauT family transport system permease protein
LKDEGMSAMEMSDTSIPAAAPAPAKKASRSPAPLFYSVGSGLALLIAWELFVRLGNVSPLLLPAPSEVLLTMANNLPLLLHMSAITVAEFLLGFFLAIVVGLPLGALVVFSRPVRLAVYPLLVAFQTIPKAAVAPIFIVWLGAGMTSKVLIAFAISFFPIVIDTVIGLRSAQPETIYLVRSMGASAIKVFWYVRFPAALPAIFGGLKVASTLAVVGAIVGEFVSADRGLGYLVLVANGELNTRLVFGCVVMLTLLGTLFYGILEILEKIAVRWHVSARQLEGLDGGH